MTLARPSRRYSGDPDVRRHSDKPNSSALNRAPFRVGVVYGERDEPISPILTSFGAALAFDRAALNRVHPRCTRRPFLSSRTASRKGLCDMIVVVVPFLALCFCYRSRVVDAVSRSREGLTG